MKTVSMIMGALAAAALFTAAAAKKGAEDAKTEYSGSWKPVRETMVFSLNHQVAPKEQALKCKACHAPDGVIDFRKLGYSEEKAKALLSVKE